VRERERGREGGREREKTHELNNITSYTAEFCNYLLDSPQAPTD